MCVYVCVCAVSAHLYVWLQVSGAQKILSEILLHHSLPYSLGTATVTEHGSRGHPVISSDSPVLLSPRTSVIGKSDHGPALGPKLRSSWLHSKWFYLQGFQIDVLFFMAKKGDLTLPLDFESEIYACLLIEAFALTSPHIIPDTPKSNTSYTCGHLVCKGIGTLVPS